MRVRDVLKTEKIPYLLTALFLMIGWSVNHSVTRLLSTPIIEYRIQESKRENGERSVEATISNVSRDQLFTNTTFMLLMVDGKVLAEPHVELISMYAGPEPNFRDRFVSILLPELHPGWGVRLTFRTTSSKPPILTFSNKSDQAILLTPKGLETFLVSNEMKIHVFLIFMWFVLIGFYFIVLPEKPEVI